MPPDLGSPQDWILRARSDLAIARIPKGPEVFWADLCFHCQQAVEKAIKAVLVAREKEFPKTHAVAKLLTIAEEAGIALPEEAWVAADLTKYATDDRYPGPPPATEADYRSALDLTEAVVAWAEKVISAA